MKVVVKLGTTPSTNNTKNVSIPYYDDFKIMKQKMDEVLFSEENINLENIPPHFLVYISALLLRGYVYQNNDEARKRFQKQNYITKEMCGVFEVDEDGNETCIQDERGLVDDNYYNKLMGSIMNDYYDALNFFE